MITSRDLAVIPWPCPGRSAGPSRADPARSPETRAVSDGAGATPDVVAGMLLLNAVPHTLMGLAGHRCRTPWGGASSSPGQNLAWAALNLGGALTLLAARRRPGPVEAERRRMRVGAGMCAMAVFGVLYDSSPAGRRDRALRTRSASAAGEPR